MKKPLILTIFGTLQTFPIIKLKEREQKGKDSKSVIIYISAIPGEDKRNIQVRRAYFWPQKNGRERF